MVLCKLHLDFHDLFLSIVCLYLLDFLLDSIHDFLLHLKLILQDGIACKGILCLDKIDYSVLEFLVDIFLSLIDIYKNLYLNLTFLKIDIRSRCKIL